MQLFKRRILALVAIFFVTAFSFSAHTSVMAIGVHDSGSKSHATKDNSLNCVTPCFNYIFNKDETVTAIREDEDDEPALPYYVEFQSSPLLIADARSRLYSAAVKPPPKVPIYLLYRVYRV